MVVRNYLLRDFSVETKEIESVVIPKGSKLLDCKPIPTGIMLWYEVSEIAENLGANVTHRFKILKHNEKVPENSEFIAIIDIIQEADNTEEQKIIILPVYRLL